MISSAVLTISDSVSSGSRVDRSGPAVRERLEQLGWKVSVMETIPDEARERILRAALQEEQDQQRQGKGWCRALDARYK